MHWSWSSSLALLPSLTHTIKVHGITHRASDRASHAARNKTRAQARTHESSRRSGAAFSSGYGHGRITASGSGVGVSVRSSNRNTSSATSPSSTSSSPLQPATFSIAGCLHLTFDNLGMSLENMYCTPHFVRTLIRTNKQVQRSLSYSMHHAYARTHGSGSRSTRGSGVERRNSNGRYMKSEGDDVDAHAKTVACLLAFVLSDLVTYADGDSDIGDHHTDKTSDAFSSSKKGGKSATENNASVNTDPSAPSLTSPPQSRGTSKPKGRGRVCGRTVVATHYEELAGLPLAPLWGGGVGVWRMIPETEREENTRQRRLKYGSRFDGDEREREEKKNKRSVELCVYHVRLIVCLSVTACEYI